MKYIKLENSSGVPTYIDLAAVEAVMDSSEIRGGIKIVLRCGLTLTFNKTYVPAIVAAMDAYIASTPKT